MSLSNLTPVQEHIYDGKGKIAECQSEPRNFADVKFLSLASRLIGDLTVEEYREYDFGGRIYRIEAPVSLYYDTGSSVHKVVDKDGIVHCVPAPGKNGCVLRWKSKDPSKPVEF